MKRIALGLVVGLVLGAAVAASATPAPCNGDAARCHTGSFTLYVRGEDGKTWYPQNPRGISEGDCREEAVVVTGVTKTPSACIADDRHVAYVYFPDGHWETVKP